MSLTEQKLSKMEHELEDLKATNMVVGSLARCSVITQTFSASGTLRVQFTPKSQLGRYKIISITPVQNGAVVPAYLIEPQDGSGKVVMRVMASGSVTVTAVSTTAGTLAQI